MKTKIETLAEFLECSPSDLRESPTHYGMDSFAIGLKEYAIADDDEANEAAEDYIRDTAWAFNATFILSQCGLPQELAECLESFQETKCESANDAISSLIYKTCGWDAFVEAAISADGRGHLLSPYDGEEHELDDYYIYRIN